MFVIAQWNPARSIKQMGDIQTKEVIPVKDKIQMWFAWRLPKWLVKWAAVRLVAHATTGEYGSTVVPELTAMDALKRWEGALT